MMVGVVGRAVGCDGRGGREGGCDGRVVGRAVGCDGRWSGWSGGL